VNGCILTDTQYENWILRLQQTLGLNVKFSHPDDQSNSRIFTTTQQLG